MKPLEDRVGVTIDLIRNLNATGSYSNGTTMSPWALGASSSQSETGVNSRSNSTWLASVNPSYGYDDPYGQTSLVGLYGISDTLVSRAAVPEPGTISLMLGPAFLLLGKLRRRRNRLAALTT